MKTEIINNEHLLIKFTNDDSFEVALCTLGASIFSIKLDNQYMTQTFKRYEDFYLNSNYHGKTIGRFANRFKGNLLRIDGVDYALENNEGENVLHGGINGISSKDFDYQIDCFDDGVYATFYHFSKDGESGYPGNVKLSVRYTLYNKTNDIDIEYMAETDKKTLWSITNHTFYCLGMDTCEDLKLTINSDRFICPDAKTLLPLDIQPVKPCLDFFNGKLLKEDFDNPYLQNSKTKGYDHFFFFKECDFAKTQVMLESNNYELEVLTDFPGAQIYGDCHPSDSEFMNSKKKYRRGLAIEPGYGQNEHRFLDIGDKYNQKIKLKFKRK